MKQLGLIGLLAVIYAAAALLVAVFGNLPEGGYHFWPFALLGLALVGWAAWRTGNRWLWLLAPLVLSPMMEIIILVTAVLFGFRLSML